MGSECNDSGGDGGDVVPAAAKKVVQSLKEIVDCTEQEIYAVLKECDMDPNLAVEKLLAQDKFHEVRSKRERRKENKEAFDSRTATGIGFGRGGRIGNGRHGGDRGVVQSGLAKVTYNAYVEYGKDADKQGVGSGHASVMPPATHGVGRNSKNVSFNTDDGRQSLGRGDSMSNTSLVFPGAQPMSKGLSKGHLSMADIVRMGSTSQDAVSNDHFNSSVVSSYGNLESSFSLHSENNTEQQFVHNKWPVTEQPCIGNAQALNMSASSNAVDPPENPNFPVTAVSLDRNCELDGMQVSRGEIAGDSATSEITESASLSNKHNIMSRNTRLGSHSSEFGTSCKHREDVSSVGLDLQLLNVRESKVEVPSSEDTSTVVLPTHVQALSAECSHLSFGTYKGGKSSASSGILASNRFRSGLEEKPAAVDDSFAQFPDASYVNDGGEHLGGTSGDPNYDFQSSPWPEIVKNIISEDTPVDGTMSDPSLQKSHWANPSLPSKQPGLQSGSYSSFPKELLQHNDSNLMRRDVLAFLRSRTQQARYNNAESSIGNFAIPMSEVKEPGTFALHKNRSPPSQNLIAQSKIHFQQPPDMEAYYHSLPQNQSYMTTINPQQAFSDSTSYNQSHADLNYNLPQSRNEFLMGRLTPASNASGYGNLGSSFSSPGSFLSNPSLGNMKSSSNFNEILPSEYSGGRNLSSTQQNGSFSQRGYVTESRSSILPERTQYAFMGQQPSQASLAQYVSPGYSDFHHSQTPVSGELGQSGGFKDWSPEELRKLLQQRNRN